MSRKLNQRQRQRIAARQQAHLKDIDSSQLQDALVIAHRGKKITVETAQQETLACHFRANLDQLVCGDEVRIDAEQKIIVARNERRSFLQRRDGFGHLKPVAANIDQMLICLSVRPAPNLLLLDQYLAVAECSGIEALILLHKADLLDDENQDPFGLQPIYPPLDYRILHTSTKAAEGLDTLKPELVGRNSIFLGLSGVGKSSIIQALLPDQDIRVGAISEHNEEGTHTTRSSAIYHLPDGGRLIDTPGVRGFTPVLNPEDIAQGFREIPPLAQHCRFNNCQHDREPGCAVNRAIEAGDMHPSRYQHFQQLLQQMQQT